MCWPPLNCKNYLDVSEIMNAVQTIKKHVKHNKSITICIRSTVLPGTCDLINKTSNFSVVHNPEFLSQGTAIDDFINAKINVYDPKGINSYKKIYGNKVSYYDEIDKCISECDIIIIATEWDTIKNYDFNKIKTNKTVYIYDFKSCIDTKNKFNCNIKYWSLGGNINGK